MDAQFVVYNDAGIEQISFGGINLSLIRKVVIPISSWTAISGPQAAGLMYSFTVTASKPVVAIASNTAGQTGASVAVVTPAGTGQWTVTLYGSADETRPTAAGTSQLNATVSVYVFDEAPAPTSSSDYGLVLYDAGGKCIFNARYPGARVAGLVDYVYGGPSNNAYDSGITPPAGRSYAAVLRSQWGRQIVGSRNTYTGDELMNEYRWGGIAGGLNGTVLKVGYPCFLNGAVSVAKVSFGNVGDVYRQFGSYFYNGTANAYYSDALVLDVTNL